jgi:hypothetical protein
MFLIIEKIQMFRGLDEFCRDMTVLISKLEMIIKALRVALNKM